MYCQKCGAEVQGRFCPRCGAAVSDAIGADQPQSTGGHLTGGSARSGLSDNAAGALAYVLGLITGIVFLAISPFNRSKFVRFHAFQSIFFHVAFIIFSIIQSVLAYALPWGAFAVLNMVFILIWVAAVALWVFLIVKALNGEKFKLPVIGDLAEKQA